MHKKFLLSLIVILLSCKADKPATKEGAIEAFKEIIKTYYDKDCEKYLSFWADSVSTLNKDTNLKFPSSLLTGGKKSKCTHFDKVTETTKTYENYLKNYSIEAVSYSEFKFGNRDSLLRKWDAIKKSNGGWTLMYISIFNKYYGPNDVLVIGDVPKGSSEYMYGPFLYLLRKTNDGWKIIGVIL